MAHLTPETKEAFRMECERRNIGMSEQISNLVEEWLLEASNEEIGKIRSNKRLIDLSKGKEIELLPAIPGHSHSLGADGRPTCGCVIKHGQIDVALPLDGNNE